MATPITDGSAAVAPHRRSSQAGTRLSKAPDLSIVVPAFNEARSIGSTLEAIQRFLEEKELSFEVVVASDGDDDTPLIVQSLAADRPWLKLAAKAGRHGKGHGLRRGMKLVSGAVVGFLDADYKTPIDELEKLLPWLRDGYDIVVGSRNVADSQVLVRQPAYRQVGSQLFALGMHTIVGLREIRDTQCGFKFFKLEVAREIFRRARIDGYMCDVEILSLAKQLGYRVKEVGISWQDDGDSRLQLVRGNLRNALDLLRIRFYRHYDRSIQTP